MTWGSRVNGVSPSMIFDGPGLPSGPAGVGVTLLITDVAGALPVPVQQWVGVYLLCTKQCLPSWQFAASAGRVPAISVTATAAKNGWRIVSSNPGVIRRATVRV